MSDDSVSGKCLLLLADSIWIKGPVCQILQLVHTLQKAERNSVDMAASM